MGLAVWIIYLTDHLLDSAKEQRFFSSKYKLYHDYRKYLLGLLLVLCGAGLVMVIEILSMQSIIAGLILIGLLVLYFMGQHFLKGEMRKFFPKEIIIAVIYIAAIWIIPVLQSETPDLKYQPFIFLHFLLVLANVSLFSMFEKPEDLLSHKDSFFGSLSTRHLKTIIITLALGSLIMSLVVGSKSIYTVLPFIIISVVYFIEAVFARVAFIARYYAEITDGVFLLFLIFFLPNFSV